MSGRSVEPISTGKVRDAQGDSTQAIPRAKPTVLKHTLKQYGYRKESASEGQHTNPNKSFHRRMARPASRKQQPCCEIRGPGELPLKLLLQVLLRAHFQQGTQEPIRSLAPLHAALTRAQTRALSGVPGSRRRCFWWDTDSPGTHTITRRERGLLLVLQLRNLTCNTLCYPPDKPQNAPSSFSQFAAKGKQKW